MAPIGPRVWKTGLAVSVAILLVRLTGHPYEVYGAVAAALAVAPSASRSLRTMTHQIVANLIGGLIGSLAILLLGPSPLVIGGAVIAVLWLCQHFGYRDLAPMVVTVTLFVMAPHSDSVTTYTIWRLVAVLIGSVVGTAVNYLILRPDYTAATLGALQRAGAAVDDYVRRIAARLAQPHSITKAEILAEAAPVEAQITEARRLSLLLAESGPPLSQQQQELLGRAVKVLASMLERIQIIHKAALHAERAEAYPEQVPEIASALSRLVDCRQHLFSALLDPQCDPAIAATLAELELRFESSAELPACAAEMEPFFRLYRMRSSVSYMANRLDRLRVAMESATPARAEERLTGAETESSNARPEPQTARPEPQAARPEPKAARPA